MLAREKVWEEPLPECKSTLIDCSELQSLGTEILKQGEPNALEDKAKAAAKYIEGKAQEAVGNCSLVALKIFSIED